LGKEKSDGVDAVESGERNRQDSALLQRQRPARAYTDSGRGAASSNLLQGLWWANIYYVPWNVAEKNGVGVASNEEALFHPEAVVFKQECMKHAASRRPRGAVAQ
jgi:hypothetical protein